jgi:hypothetical protein
VPGGKIRGMKLAVMGRYLYKIAVFHDRIIRGDPNSDGQHAFRLLLSEELQNLRDFIFMLLEQWTKRRWFAYFPKQLAFSIR